MTRVLYPGSFDPVTYGHLDLIRRAAKIFDEVVVAVGVNVTKESLFSADERVEMLRELTRDVPGVSAVAFEGLAVECAKTNRCETLLRGVRTVADFEGEYQMALTNRMLDPEIETVLMAPSVRYSFVSSRLIKEVLGSGGAVPDLLPDEIAARVTARLEEKRRR